MASSSCWARVRFVKVPAAMRFSSEARCNKRRLPGPPHEARGKREMRVPKILPLAGAKVDTAHLFESKTSRAVQRQSAARARHEPAAQFSPCCHTGGPQGVPHGDLV